MADRPVLGLPAMTQQRHVMIEEVVMPSRAPQLMVQEVLVPFPRRLSQKRKLRSSTSGLSTKASALAKSLQAKSSSSMLA